MMRRSYTVATNEESSDSKRSYPSRLQRWSSALRRRWFSFASATSRIGLDTQRGSTGSVEVLLPAAEQTILQELRSGASSSFPLY
ncbi:unnamed protein product [Thelazia callipaeda]|uniref:Uncharacterized protein n=1 Tax=Thelazia callipaeda TaxID=103827 RepID=A0A0N5CYT4_THECL|nr:unnamed protein product [Thelazia callipaeda]